MITESVDSAIIRLINAAGRDGIVLFTDNGKLKYRLKPGYSISESWVEKIKEHKEGILAFFDEHQDELRKASSPVAVIIPGERPEQLPLSYGQERLWFIDKLQGSVQYHIPLVFRLKGNLCRKSFENAFRYITDRHEVLRTIFSEKDGDVYQAVSPGGSFTINYCTMAEVEETGASLETFTETKIKEPFNLASDYMLRVQLLEQAPDDYQVIAVLHHIAADGWSMRILLREFTEVYKAFATGMQAYLPPLGIQYADYAVWQKSEEQTRLMAQKLDYWKKQLKDTASLELPADFTRPALQSSNGAICTFSSGSALAAKVNRLAQEEDATLFMTLLAAFKVLLYRYTGQEDICVGTPAANRIVKDTDPLIGLFINTLVLRSYADSEASFSSLLQQVKRHSIAAFSNQDVPFEKIVEQVVTGRDMSRTPLFQVMFVLQNNEEFGSVSLHGITLSQVPAAQVVAKYDITFTVTESAEGFNTVIEYCTDLFTEEKIRQMYRHYVQLLESVTAQPGTALNSLKMLSAEEQLVIESFNPPSTPLPADITVVDLIEKCAAENGQAAALVFEGRGLTYTQMDVAANQLAHYLRSKGITTESRVAICMERCLEMAIAIAGILKAGACYVPVDPLYPAERIHYMLEDSGAQLMLVKGSVLLTQLTEIAGELPIEVLEYDIDGSSTAHFPATAVKTDLGQHNAAYIIYTSGSTGRPKGVITEHRSLLNRLLWAAANHKITSSDTVLQKTTFCFDVSVWEFLLPLIKGAVMLIAKPGGEKDPVYLRRLIRENKVTIVHFVPPALEVFLLDIPAGDIIPCLKLVVCSGEALKNSHVTLFRSKLGDVRLLNLYGPTEAAIDVSFWEAPAGTFASTMKVLIGKPVWNTRLYILDAALNLCPPGVAGELYIGGEQVARGYIGRPDLNREKFVPDHFSKAGDKKLYRTGDLCRWTAGGEIEYIGRTDDQVKIRGYRIELGEIENVLRQHEQVSKCVIVSSDHIGGSRQLAAYVVPRAKFEKDHLIKYLAEQLPEYMIPAIWVEMDELPLTSNGKIDRRALPEPLAGLSGNREFIAPRTDTEMQLAAVWQEFLGVQEPGIHDNFFELGGHSLLAARIVAAVRQQLSKDISIRDIFIYPTIEKLSAYLEGIRPGLVVPPVVPQQRSEIIPLSFDQERIWMIDQLNGSTEYHMPVALRITGKLDKLAVEHAARMVIKRHEILRTVFRIHDDIPVQVIQPYDDHLFSITEIDAAGREDDALKKMVEGCIAEPFDLANELTIRIYLLCVSDIDSILVINLHHIATDGWSTPLMIRDFIEFFRSYTEKREARLPELSVQYADYAIWQRNYLQGELLEKKLGYWKKKLEGHTPLSLPVKSLVPLKNSNRGAIYVFHYSAEMKAGLKKLAKEEEATLFMVMLALFNILLQRHSGQNDFCIGVPVADRLHRETENLLGFFVNTLAFRTPLGGNPTFRELLQRVKQNTLDNYDHQDIPFEKVVEAVGGRDGLRHPVFQVMFTLENNRENPRMVLGDVEFVRQPFEQHTALFELSLVVKDQFENDNKLILEYNTDLFSESFIAGMGTRFLELIKSVTDNPDLEIASLGLLSASDQKELSGFQGIQLDTGAAGATVLDLLEPRLLKGGNSTALSFGTASMSYTELNERSHELARVLRSAGVCEEVKVGICMERGFELVISLLAVLRSGGCYVPFDPSYPASRLRYMLEDSGAGLVLYKGDSAAAQLRDISGDLPVALLQYDLSSGDIPAAPAGSASSWAPPEPGNLSYIIYTSGSTGRPKGVMLEHGSLYRFMCWCREEFSEEDYEVLYAVTSVCFDISVFELLFPLTEGRRMRILENGLSLRDWLGREERVLVNTVPSVVNALIADGVSFTGVTVLNMAGEPIPLEVQRSLDVESMSVRNLYGPTEDTIYSTVYRLVKNRPLLIGHPKANSRIYIAGEYGDIKPAGIPGEICIGGGGLARGYVNLPDETASRFVSGWLQGLPSTGVVYRTGDLGRWTADGEIEYLGRKDDQVKIRGFRIELGEIENVLNGTEGVTDSVVIAGENSNGEKILIAFAVVKGVFDQQLLKEAVANKLPEYMVPQIWIKLEQLPLMPNGKKDRGKLRELAEAGAGKDTTSMHAEPVTPAELLLHEIWCELLAKNRISIDDNFFALGGHSLLAMRQNSILKKRSNINLPLKTIFDHPTIRGLAKLVTADMNNVVSSPVAEQADNIASVAAAADSSRPVPVSRRPGQQIPLSYSQERLWFIDQLEGSVHYHIPVMINLKGELNEEALLHAFRSIVQRHEMLRTVFCDDDTGASQKIQGWKEWQLGIIRGEAAGTNRIMQKKVAASLIGKPFDLSRDYLLRADLLDNQNGNVMLVVVVHHIAADGWSMPILMGELQAQYQAFVSGEKAALPKLPVQYADYAIWQRSNITGDKLEEGLQYWEESLSGVSPLQLPTDFPRRPIQSTRGTTIQHSLSAELTSRIRTECGRYAVSPFILMMGVFKILMYRYTGQEDVCVGTPVAGRNYHELEGLVGFFVSTVAFRSEVSGKMEFGRFMASVRDTVLLGYEHQDVPFEKIVERVVKQRDLSRSPVFQVMFVMQNNERLSTSSVLTAAGLDMELTGTTQEHSKFDLSLYVEEHPDGFKLIAEYCTDLFAATTIRRMLAHYEQLLNSVIEGGPQVKLSSLGLLSASDQKELSGFQGVQLDTGAAGATVLDLLEPRLLKGGNTTALSFGEASMSYAELNERSHELARVLRSAGVCEEVKVGICMERGFELVISVLAVLRSGGCYVPFDPSYPASRLRYMLEDSGAGLVLYKGNSAAAQLRDISGDLPVALLQYDLSSGDIPAAPAGSASSWAPPQPGNLSYIIYTSGSTGRPKGVMLEHGSLYRFMCWCREEFSEEDYEVLYAVTSVCFDISVFELLFPLTVGRRMRILENGLSLRDWLGREERVLVNTVPSVVNALIADGVSFTGVTVLNMAGEPIPLEVQRSLDVELMSVRNLYGPTEDTIYSTVYRLVKNRPLLIGHPKANSRIYIAGEYGDIKPAGIPGEICIGGGGLARGYVNLPDETASRFVSGWLQGLPSTGVVYRTGDLGRWTADGEIEYLGRKDDQVKIRGFRIELGEIERLLEAHENVTKTAVLAKDDGAAGKRLVAYVSGNGLDADELRSYLKTKLPEFMIPAAIVILDRMPVNPNGKTDKKELARMQVQSASKQQYEPPRNDIDERLIKVWQEYLHGTSIGISDDFFELGGHSLLALRIARSVETQFGVKMEIRQMFSLTTIKKMSDYIAGQPAAL